VIPEHTDRAARIKQSRVKMMRLKAKIGRGGCRIHNLGEKKREKISKDFKRQGIKI